MPKILITGNGFDLSYGLPTGYSDFIAICKKLQNYSEFSWDDLKEDIVALNSTDKLPTSSFTNFNDFKTRLNENTWFRYLSREYTINTWIDFEKYIEKALETILYHIDEIRAETFLTSGRYRRSEDLYLKQGFDQKKYEIYLTLIDFKVFLVQDGFNPRLNPFFLKSINEYYVDFEKENLFAVILDDLNEFRKIFSEYLLQIVTPLYEILIDESKSILLKDITHHFTFNYTPTFDKLIPDGPLTTYIHGELCNNNIILGINDWEDKKADGINLIPFTKYFQKLNFGITLKFINEIKSRDNFHQFFFWGHSLNKSDAIYINEVFDKIDSLEKERSQGKIIIIYHSDNSRFNIIKNLIEIRGSEDIMKKQRAGQLEFINCESEILKKELNLKLRTKSAPGAVEIY